MVLMNESFVNMFGEEVTRESLVQGMVDYFNNKYPSAGVTDFNEGSVIRNILESLSVDVYHMERNQMEAVRIGFITTAYGQYLDMFGADEQLPRNTGSYGNGKVTFTIPEALTYELMIPSGTVLVDQTTGYFFDTITDCFIKIGETSTSVAVFSEVVGSATNSVAGDVCIIRDAPVHPSLTVTNSNDFVGGADYESDDEYRIRLLGAKARDSFGSKDYYTNLGEAVTGVHDVFLTTATGYTGKVIVNGNDKPVTDTILAGVVAEFSDPSKIVFDQTFTCEKVTYTTINLEITCTVKDTIATSVFESALTVLFDGGGYNDNIYTGCRINEKLSKFQVLSCLELIEGVVSITNLTSSNSSFTDLTPATNKVLKLGTVTVSQTIAE